MAGLKNRIRDITCATKPGIAVWNLMKRIKQTLFYRRRRIPPNMSVTDFIQKLHECRCRYVILRWFDELPDVRPGDDLDILVHDRDVELIDSLLIKGTKGIACDVYSVSGLPGFNYYGVPYYPPAKAADILQRSVINEIGVRIPSEEDHFYSLAFHAVYHKGKESGLPVSFVQPAAVNEPKRDFTKILTQLGKELVLDVKINAESLSELLNEKGWNPSAEMLKKLKR